MKSVRYSFFLLLLLGIGSSLCTAQRQSAEQPAQEAAAREQRRIDEEAVRKMDDPGADVAFVTAIKANIREQPSKTSLILKEVKAGRAVLNGTRTHGNLVSRDRS